jgi:hypothetical protein
MDIILSFVVYGLLLFLIVYFAFRNMVLRRNLQNVITDRLQAEVNKNIIMSEYSLLAQEVENMKLEKSDDFVKFLSTSREMAFTYIEDAQQKIVEFDKLLQEVAEWNRTYGTVAGNVPHAEKIEKISLAYDSIRELLPEKPTPNN